MSRAKGEILYKIYRALTYVLSPVIHLHLRWRKFRGLEHPQRWPERLGRPSLPRPVGPLVWFHAVSLGESIAAIPVIKCCLNRRPDVTVLMTSTTISAFEVIKNRLPYNALYQFAPLDTPVAVEAFLGYWKPNAILLMESELWPNVIMSAARNGIALALLNARISTKSFKWWSLPVIHHLPSLLLSKFSLIVPLSNMQAIQFQLLQAPPFVIDFSGDLKYIVEGSNSSEGEKSSLDELQNQLARRKVWMASSLHKGEEKIMLRVHKVLKEIHSDVVTIIVSRHPQHGQDIALELQKKGIKVAVRSHHEELLPGINIYVVDTLGELREFYRLTPIAVIGGSFLPGSSGHNISEAATAGCAILTGHYVGHFSHMVKEMQRLNPLSVQQVSEEMLVQSLIELFSDAKILEARRIASKQAYHALSCGVLENLWSLVQFHILDKATPVGKLLADLCGSASEGSIGRSFHEQIAEIVLPNTYTSHYKGRDQCWLRQLQLPYFAYTIKCFLFDAELDLKYSYPVELQGYEGQLLLLLNAEEELNIPDIQYIRWISFFTNPLRE